MRRDASGYGQLTGSQRAANKRPKDSSQNAARPKASYCACIGGSPKVPYANGETSHIKSDALAAAGDPRQCTFALAQNGWRPLGVERTGWHTTHAAPQKPAAASLQTSKHAIAGPEPPKGRAANGGLTGFDVLILSAPPATDAGLTTNLLQLAAIAASLSRLR